MAAKTITAFKLRTELIADATKQAAEFKKAEGAVQRYTDQVKKSQKEIDKEAAKAGKKAANDFVTAFKGSIDNIGQTLGTVIGTAIAPGIGTAIGSTVGSGIDTALQKVSGPILEQITHGIELNKLLERSRVHFTTFIGDEKEAVAHLEQLKKLSDATGLRLGVLVEGSQRLEEFTDKLGLTRLFMRAAADQSAKFYGDATIGFDDMANALGRIVLKGEDVGKLLKKLEGQGVHWKQYVAEGLGITEKKAAELIKAGHIKGEGIATLVAQGIERHAGGFAQMMGTVGPGVEQVAGARLENLSATATQRIGGGIEDAYRKFNQLLASPEAEKIVEFIDKMGGYVVDFTETAVKKGVSIGGGIAEGLMNFSPASMMQSFTKLGDFVEGGLKTIFEMKSPSERIAREIGEPMGEGLGVGMVRKFRGFIEGQGKEEIIATLEQLLKDPRVKAFMDLITRSEVGNDPNPAARLFGPLGHVPDPSQFFAAKGGWPGMRVKSPTLGRVVWTHPLGGKQIEPGTAKMFSRATGTNLPMDAHTQDLIATWLITQTRGALEKILGGDPLGAMKLLRPTWESFSVNSPGKTTALVNQFNASVAGKPISDTNPMPVKISAGEGKFLDALLSQAERTRRDILSSNNPQAAPIAGVDQQQKSRAVRVRVAESVAIVERMIPADQDLISTTALTTEQIAGMTVNMRPLVPLIEDVSDSARAAYAINADIQKKNRQLYIENISLGQQIIGAFQQISGMIPGQEVGRKRGFFSKLLGFAAPFLSFIPGVGPILSTIAGAASGIAGGNYGAAVSSIAGGLQPGGVFRAGPSGSSTPSHKTNPPHRAMGGPVRSGLSYIVGERRPELFVPNQDGYIHPTAMGGGGLHPAVLSILRELAAEIGGLRTEVGRLRAFPADHIVAAGARGLQRAFDRDASLAEGMGRRLRLP